MRIHICAVGRIRSGPERDLINGYKARFDRSGRGLGLGPVTEHEVEPRKTSGKAAEAKVLVNAIPQGAIICALDERGHVLTSPDFAKRLGQWRDQGVQDTAFVIGGADGLDAGLRANADFALSFGAMVWPHALARVMLAEQLYRAASILAGSPYHRV